MSFTIFVLLTVFLASGFIAGILSSVFGIGGGLIIVPILYWAFSWQAMPEPILMHMAVGTSLAIMIITSMNSAWTHHQKGNVIWPAVKPVLLWLIIGVMVGLVVSHFLHSEILRYVFILFLIYTILNALFKKDFTAEYTIEHFTMPAAWLVRIAGSLTGFLSVMLGIGGGVITMQFYRQAKMPMRNASACVSALIPAVAISGTIGYAIIGLHTEDLPKYALGFIYVPAFIGISIGTLLGVPVGAKWVHKLSDKLIARMFVGLLILTLLSMLR